GSLSRYSKSTVRRHRRVSHFEVEFAFYTVIIVIPCWRILKKAGYPPALSLLAMVPLVNVIALWFFAFAKWPKGSTNG
ncbi:hypothetical protein, partial [Aeromonas rivipollensis]|uniref:hypothetical protein n=1 Tax=Aeromonas rivipollensis TaxID=948519 RepID=UPI003D2071E7